MKVLIASASLAIFMASLAQANEVNKFGRSNYSWNFKSPTEKIAAERRFMLRCVRLGHGCNLNDTERTARRLSGAGTGPGLFQTTIIGNQINAGASGEGNSVTVSNNDQSNSDSTLSASETISDSALEIVYEDHRETENED